MTPDDYVAAFYRLLPRGPIWPRSPGENPTWDALIDACANEPARIDASAEAWLADYFPDATTDQLPDWERLLGLPSCGLSLGSLSERRGAVLGLLRRRGNPTLANIQAIADGFARDAVVSTGGTGDLFFVGIDTVGDNVLAMDDATITVLVTYDGPQSDTLECTLRHSLPIHLTVSFEVV